MVAFLGAKGGVGTTTAAVNVAAALAQENKSVIAVELRPCYGTLIHHLRRSAPTYNLRHVFDLDKLNQHEISLRLSGAIPRLQVLFGPQRPEEFKEIDAGQAVNILDEMTRMADVTILDLPCQPSDANAAAVRKSDYVVLVVEREPSSFAAGRVALDLLRSWGVPQERVGALVMNRSPAVVSQKLVEVRFILGCDIIGVIPLAADVCAAGGETPRGLSTSERCRSRPGGGSRQTHVGACPSSEICLRLGKEGVGTAGFGCGRRVPNRVIGTGGIPLWHLAPVP